MKIVGIELSWVVNDAGVLSRKAPVEGCIQIKASEQANSFSVQRALPKVIGTPRRKEDAP